MKALLHRYADLENLILQEAQGWEQWIAAVQEIHFEHEFFTMD